MRTKRSTPRAPSPMPAQETDRTQVGRMRSGVLKAGRASTKVAMIRARAEKTPFTIAVVCHGSTNWAAICALASAAWLSSSRAAMLARSDTIAGDPAAAEGDDAQPRGDDREGRGPDVARLPDLGLVLVPVVGEGLVLRGRVGGYGVGFGGLGDLGLFEVDRGVRLGGVRGGGLRGVHAGHRRRPV